jgi:phosphoribosyl-ATP pyrophosphohydrolase
MAIKELYETILKRKTTPTEGSYTSTLFTQGLARIAQKVGEEGTEVVVAALSQPDERLVEEIADLTYHVLVLMAARGIEPQAIARELEKRRK